MTAVLFFLVTVTVRAADPAPPPTELACNHVTPIQVRFLQRHVSFTDLTVDLQNRTVAQFMKRQDGSKIFLLEPDIKEIESSMQNIFVKTSKQDCTPLLK